MKRSLILAVVVVLSAAGCGVESVSTAATVAAAKQKELEAAQETKAQVEKQVGQAVEQLQVNVQKQGEADK